MDEATRQEIEKLLSEVETVRPDYDMPHKVRKLTQAVRLIVDVLGATDSLSGTRSFAPGNPIDPKSGPLEEAERANAGMFPTP